MSEDDIPMAQCGACNSIIPLDSESCPDCGIRFGGVSDEELGECGACQAIIPADSVSCSNCGAIFVETEPEKSMESVDESVDEVTTTEVVSTPSITPVPSEDAEEDSSEVIEETSVVEDDIQDGSQVDETPAMEEDLEEETETVEEVTETSEVEEPSAEEEIEVTAEEEEVEDSAVEEPESESSVEEAPDEEVESEIEVSEEVSESEGLETEEITAEDTLEEDSVETMMDDLVDELDEDSDESEESDTEESEDDVVEEKEPETVIEDNEVVMAFENLALAIAAKGMTAADAFGEMDSSDDNQIDAPELQKGIEKIAGEKLSPKHVTAILNYLDTDENRRIDGNEFVKALEDMRIGIQPGKLPKVKTFPSPLQKFLMGKKANDIVYPIAYFLMVTFIGIWVVNGMGLLVDGSGGTVVYEGGTDQWGGEITTANWNLCQSDAFDEMIDPCSGTVSVGETYPCDPALDPNKCQNSLTPFSGENGASSMPAAFYGDGIFMIILGVIGLGATAFLHLMYAPALREKAKKGTGNQSNEESDEETQDEEEIEESEEEDEEVEESEADSDDGGESALEAPVDLEIADEDDEDDDGEYDDDDIDIGDWIGLDIDGGEFFGEIIEFDEDEGTVTIETEDGEEVTGDQEDMFLDEE